MPTPLLPHKCGAPGCNRLFAKPEDLHQHTKEFHLPSKLRPKQNVEAPKPLLPHKCGTPGCNQLFAKPENLHQHTKEFHLPSKLLPKQNVEAPKPLLPHKCGAPGCNRLFVNPEHLHQHVKDFHLPSKPLPKQRTFKCGAEGCKAANFSQISLLHQHTSEAHPKSSKNTPSGSATSAFSTQGHQIPVSNTRLTQAPVSMTQHVLPRESYLPPPSYTASEAQYASPYVSSRRSSISTSLAAQNAVSSPDYSPAAFATPPPLEEVLQRITQLELQRILIDKSTLKVGMHFVKLAETVILSSTNDRTISFLTRLQEHVECMSKHNNVCSLAYSAKLRTDVRKLLQDLGYNDSIEIQKAFREDDQDISHLFREVIHSGKEEILDLSDEKATGFMDALHKCIMESDDAPFALPAQRLLKNLCAATKAFPPILFLELDSLDRNRQIGRGEFADIFRGKYKEQDIALKRLRVYKQEPNEMLEFSKSLLQEVLTWVHLKHIYVLPFLGLDKQSFEDYPPCIITPYMRNGTMKDFVKKQNGTLPDRRVDRLLFETAQGLAYLHSQNMVHGNLRGGNVLIDSGERAQLANFGLAIVTDATLGTTSTTQRGSCRWMAPELLNYHDEFKRTKACDVYAFACLCIEIYTGGRPFWNIKPDAAVAIQILEQKRPPRPSSLGPPDGTRAMSDGLWAIVGACWAHEPSDRPDMNKVSGLIMVSP
ncbi:kinase-like domain-containing protein [Mycena vulgaris]|nr:kinase-like domain-containing protein [Mycena vulgaris]